MDGSELIKSRPELFDDYDGTDRMPEQQAAFDAQGEALMTSAPGYIKQAVAERRNNIEELIKTNPDAFDYPDCSDAPYKDPREDAGFQSLPDYLKAAVEAASDGAAKSPSPPQSNGYEFDCEPRVITEAARKQWAAGVPDWFNAIDRKKEGSEREAND